jgi:hypothetical protein
MYFWLAEFSIPQNVSVGEQRLHRMRDSSDPPLVTPWRLYVYKIAKGREVQTWQAALAGSNLAVNMDAAPPFPAFSFVFKQCHILRPTFKAFYTIYVKEPLFFKFWIGKYLSARSVFIDDRKMEVFEWITQWITFSYLLHASFLLGLFDPEDGGDIFLRNICLLSTDYTTLYPRSQNSSYNDMLMNIRSLGHMVVRFRPLDAFTPRVSSNYVFASGDCPSVLPTIVCLHF